MTSLSSISYLLKCKLLLAGFVIFILLFYKLSFVPTWQLLNETQVMEEKRQAVQQAPERINYLQSELKLTEALFMTDSLNGNLQHNLIDEMAVYCNQSTVTVKEIPMQVMHKQDYFLIETFRIRLEGEFKSLLQLLFLMEKKYPGKIASVHFASIKNYKTRIPVLYADFYFQHIKPDNYAK